MGSLAKELGRGLKSMTPFAAHTIQLLESGITFSAPFGSSGLVEPSVLLGSDPREQVVFRCMRDDVPDELMKADAESNIAITIDGVRHNITKREDSISNPIVKFTAVKVV